jgi:hypothetical protein
VTRSVGSTEVAAPTAGPTTVPQWSSLRQPTSNPAEAAAQVEEMVARTHERAAELYESWGRRRGETVLDDLERRAHAHREMAAAARSVERLAGRALDGFHARVEAGATVSGKQRSLRTLAAWERLRVLITQRIECSVDVNRRAGATWAEVAAALGVTRQTAHQRFR